MSVPNRANDPKRKAGLYTPEEIRQGKNINPIGSDDLNIVRSGASDAFKKMGFKTPMERAKARESRPGKPPLPGF